MTRSPMMNNPELIAVQVEYFDEHSSLELDTVYVNFLPRPGDLMTLFIRGKELKRTVNVVEFFVADNRDGHPDITIRLNRR